MFSPAMASSRRAEFRGPAKRGGSGRVEPVVFIDHNKVQSDRLVAETLPLGDLELKFQSFGWHVARCNGNDIGSLLTVFEEFRTVVDRPKICICDTIKGCGVSFMEHPRSLRENDGLYRWHRAPNDSDYKAAVDELSQLIGRRAADLGVPSPERAIARPSPAEHWVTSTETLTAAYGARLTDLGGQNDKLVVLDADLAVDCGLTPFRAAFPDRFIENGIAEQDMVSVAGGLALHGFLPVVNSFGCFLASRAHEQIFTNTTERTKIIYVNYFAGLLPAAPGASHQSLRDIALFRTLPRCLVVQPSTPTETVALLNYLVEETDGTSMMRLQLGRFPQVEDFPGGASLAFGRGTVLREGIDAVLFCYGPIMAAQAAGAASRLEKEGFSLRVVVTPWLNSIDMPWLERQIDGVERIFVLEDHGPVGGRLPF